MEMSSPSFAQMKLNLKALQRCLAESLEKCDNFHQDLIVKSNSELFDAKQRIIELEDENRNLRRLLDESGAVGMTESLQSDVDRHLMKAKLENEKLQQRIEDLEEEIQCLKQQVSIYKDDFEMERKDRENSHSIISELQKQIKLLNEERNPAAGDACHRVPHQFRRENRIRGFDVCDSGRDVTDRPTCFSKTVSPISNETRAFRCISPAITISKDFLAEPEVFDLRETRDDLTDLTLTGRGVDSRTVCRTTDDQICNSEMRSNRTSNASQRYVDFVSFGDVSRPSIREYSEEVAITLSCPNCMKRFSTEDHIQLIDHLEICN